MVLENPDALSDGEPETRTDVSAVLVVTDVFVSPSSVVTECCEGDASDVQKKDDAAHATAKFAFID